MLVSRSLCFFVRPCFRFSKLVVLFLLNANGINSSTVRLPLSASDEYLFLPPCFLLLLRKITSCVFFSLPLTIREISLFRRRRV